MRIIYIKRVLLVLAILIFLAISLFISGVLWPLDAINPPSRSALPLVITDVTIVDVERSALVAHQTVVIEANRIKTVANSADITLPDNVAHIDGKALFLMPALWDMHAHVYAISPMLDMPLYIAYGVTNVRDMQGCPQEDDPFIACAEDKRRWTNEALAAERIAPRVMATTSFMANGPGILERMPNLPHFFGTATPAEARAFVQHFADKVDAIKVYDRIPRDSYFALVDEAKHLGMDVVGHRPHSVSAIEAAAHQKSIEHARFILHESFDGSEELRSLGGSSRWYEDRQRMLEQHNPEFAQAIFAAMVEHGTWYVPTHLTRWSDAYAEDAIVREDPLLRYLHPLMKWQWLEDINKLVANDPSEAARENYQAFYRKGLELTAAAHAAGVKLLVGTDYIVAGADVHRELEQLVLAGLSPAEALHAATIAPAEYFDATDRFGSVAEGKIADLVLLRANPLADIRNTKQIDAVVFNGSLYNSNMLDSIKSHVKEQARSWSVGCKIIWRFIKNPVSY